MGLEGSEAWLGFMNLSLNFSAISSALLSFLSMHIYHGEKPTVFTALDKI
jgi:hypothetical protein